MADQKLLDYIRQNIGNLGEQGVKKRLADSGWEQSQISQAISEYRKSQGTPAPSSGPTGGKGLPKNMTLVIVAVIIVAAIAVVAMIFLPMLTLAPAGGPTAFCGDGTCDSGETYSSCPADCEQPAPAAFCGDGTCDSDESYDNCPGDCEKPPPSPISISVSGPGSASVGNPVSFDIAASGAKYFFGFQFNVEYDPSVLEYQSIEEGSFLSRSGADSTFCVPVNANTPGQLRNYACTRLNSGGSPTGVEGSGTIATMTFNAVGSGTSQIKLVNVKLADIDADSIPATVTDSSITVS